MDGTRRCDFVWMCEREKAAFRTWGQEAAGLLSVAGKPRGWAGRVHTRMGSLRVRSWSCPTEWEVVRAPPEKEARTERSLSVGGQGGEAPVGRAGCLHQVFFHKGPSSRKGPQAGELDTPQPSQEPGVRGTLQ